MQTKLNETIITVRDADELAALDKKEFHYAAASICRVHEEDFINEDTGETVTVERNDLMFSRGSNISKDDFSELLFHFQAGDLKEASFSNQRRVGFVDSTCWRLWKVTTGGNSKLNILLFAPDVVTAHAIVKDYIELNYKGSYIIDKMGAMPPSNVIEDPGDGDNNNNKSDNVWFQITIVTYSADLEESRVTDDDKIQEDFIIYSDCAENARKVIDEYVAERKVKAQDHEPYVLKVVGAKTISCDAVIPTEFCLAYKQESEEE